MSSPMGVAVGAWIEFRCATCGYEAMVSGKDDAGMKVSTTTVLCEECEELYDVVTFRRSRWRWPKSPVWVRSSLSAGDQAGTRSGGGRIRIYARSAGARWYAARR